jgi:excisionase family DNA binding protein
VAEQVTGRLWLTVAEYSSLTGVPAQTVRRQLREGKLRSRKVGKGRGAWRVLAREAESVRRSA